MNFLYFFKPGHFVRIVFLLFLFLSTIGCESDNQAYKRGFNTGYKKGFEAGHDEGYGKGTKVLVENSFLPTVGGVILFFAAVITAIFLYFLLKDFIKRQVNRLKLFIEKSKFDYLLKNSTLNNTYTSVEALEDFEKMVIEIVDTDLEGLKVVETKENEKQMFDFRNKYLTELETIKNRIIEIKYNIGSFKIENKKELLENQFHRILEHDNLNELEKIRRIKEIKEQFLI